MEYEYETDGAVAERLEVIAKSFYILNKNLEHIADTLEDFTDMLEDKLGGFDENNLNVTLYTDRPIMVANQNEEEK